MGLLKWVRTERAWARPLGSSAYFTRRKVTDEVSKIGGRYGELFFRPSDSDLETFWQVFQGRDYDLSRYPQGAAVTAAYDKALAEGRTPVVIDAGANVGAASVWFAAQFPKARIVAVEPEPGNARILRMNAEGRGIDVVEAAIGATPGTVSMITRDSSWGAMTERGGEIPVVTVPDLLGRYENPALILVKIDIEGFESDLFSTDTDWIAQATAIFIEPHDWMLPGKATSRSFRQAMGSDFDLLIAGENLLFIQS